MTIKVPWIIANVDHKVGDLSIRMNANAWFMHADSVKVENKLFAPSIPPGEIEQLMLSNTRSLPTLYNWKVNSS